MLVAENDNDFKTFRTFNDRKIINRTLLDGFKIQKEN